MEVSQFKIYNASAGSGKTYSLTKEYLKRLLLHGYPSQFRQLLAITFTNKAVDEMKSRILDSLHTFGKTSVPTEQGSLFHELCDELDLSPEALQERSQKLLKRILHNYSFFEISTIDRFNHKILKTFARDLQLSQNFEVELDTELLLNEAVGRLLERAGTDNSLTQVLIDFSLEKIDEDKSWNIVHDLVDIGKLLFQENHSAHLERIRSKSIGDFKTIQKNIIAQLKVVEASAKATAQKVLQEMDSQGFEPSDFPRQTLPNHFKKVVGGEFNIKTLYANKLEQSLQEGKILKASDKRDSTALASSILEHYVSIKKKLYQRDYLKNIYGNLVPLTLLNEIAKEIKNIELEREVIPISAMNALLSKEIKNQPVPFIYERMGEKYRHYFIDEFQDTSEVQWENLVPLIGNALEGVNEKNEQGSLFLVGDVKQAIYRWRGGKAEQFADLLSQKVQPFALPPQIFNLDTNWRSYSEIIRFNNDFFSTIAPFLKNLGHRNLFLEGCQQKTNANQGGYVQLSFLDTTVEDKNEAYCQEVLRTIQEVCRSTYDYGDICVLVRKNSDGMLLANFLSEHKVPLVSSESLLLKNNPEVKFLLALLQTIANQENGEAVYEVLAYLSEGTQDPHEFIANHFDALGELLFTTYGFDYKEMHTQPVLIILERAISQFDLSNGAEAYLTFLLDEVLLTEKKDGPGIHAFLAHWKQKQDSLAIAAPNHLNAVKIMTVHKSKGLEFPVVLFPFANAVVDDKRKRKKTWVPATSQEETLELEEFLINTKKEMLHYNPETSKLYREESEKTELDAINVLYVALTRAEKALYIISEHEKRPATLEQGNSYSDLFQNYLTIKGHQEGLESVFSWGSLPGGSSGSDQKTTDSSHIPFSTRPKGDSGFAISTKSSRLWDNEVQEAIELGNLIHLALSQIHTSEDVKPALVQLNMQGHLPSEAMEGVSQKIQQLIRHPQLKEYFTDDYEALNEKEILTAEGKLLRPDRIALKNKEATVIDYKTGKPSPSHKEQITQYADVLKAMGFQIRHIIIVYIDQEIKPIFL
ncbi:UvrD-helicase domain-containing protein [Flagellimonas flava]|uniref:DNA 3'-5' helicase n=1 Tax=Flagellimonas flava TaxID=570519 RepID=A0A1M5KSI0_9FLAO|nr:UvrD-helicase domain-containing protein [Allomuricauda flava]SHG55630.1 ATP-dependent exoDNAse (exonuclease V) beta subunit (contains helicase and exonuclease domains) [Allomuricauda flava]